MSTTSRIYDSGYRRYDGPRRGPTHAFWSLVTHTLQRIFGLRRPARWKVLPFLISALAFLPPAVFVGVAAFLPRQLADDALPDYGDFYGFISAVVLLFVMFVAPEALCPDRRSGVLSLYLSAPLTRARYLLAKSTAVGLALLTVTIGPVLLLLVGLTLQSAGPDGPGGLALVLVRILGSGVILAVFFTALSMAASSLTPRRAVAAGGIFIFTQLSNGVAFSLVEGANAPRWLLALSVSETPFELVRRIHGEPAIENFNVGVAPLVIGTIAWVVLAAGVAWNRYRTLQVTR